MNEWFNNLERREQWILLAGAAFVVIYILFGVVLGPLNNDVTSLTTRNQAASETLQWMHQGAAQVKKLRGGGRGNAASAQLGLSKMVDQSAAREGLRVSRFQPSGNNEAQVWLDKISFNRLVAWLDRMENTHGASVMNITINAANETGTVNVRVRFKKGL